MNNSDNNLEQNNSYQTNPTPTPVVSPNEPTMISSDMFTNTGVSPVAATTAPEVVPTPTVVPASVDNNVIAGNVNPTSNETPTINSVGVTDSNVFGTNNEGAVVNENLKKVEINYTPPSKFKMAVMIFFFILILAFVIFLPNISTLVNKYKSGQLNYKEEEITTGKLTCELESNTSKLTKNYDLVFEFTDSKLDKTKFTITTRGDPTEDEATLDELAGICDQLSDNVKNINGVTVRCEYSDGKLVETQSFDLANVDMDALDAAFTEAGGNNPEYTAGQDIDRIEKSMNASNYKCVREK